MADPAYVAAAVAVASVITVGLRAASFGVKATMRGLPLLGDLGRWMPLGVLSILTVYCLSTVSVTRSPYGVPEAIASLATVGVHLWRRNAVLSIVLGTAVYVLLVNLVMPV